MNRMLAADIAADINGNTDSEYLFACLRQILSEEPDGSVPNALRKLFVLLEDLLDELPAMLNIILTRGDRLYASRHGINHSSPSLYYSTDDELFPGGQLIASERFSEDGFWQPVPDHHILVLDPYQPPELQAL